MDITKSLFPLASVRQLRWQRIPEVTWSKRSPGLIYMPLGMGSSLPPKEAASMPGCARPLPHTQPLWSFFFLSWPCPVCPAHI